MTETKECWSINNEDFNCDTLDELLEDCQGDVRPGQTVYFGTAKAPTIGSFISVDSVIEDIAARAYDFGGEWADDYPDVTLEHKAKLQALLESWLAECPAPRFYRVVDAKPYVLTESDFSAEDLEELALQDEDKKSATTPPVATTKDDE